ncbi:MAG: His-Xaa-Ser system radical SAM maturase HxsB [Candidatus Omnitrophota bacterium]
MKNKQQHDWALLPYNSQPLKDRFLISNMLGSWQILDRKDFVRLETGQISPGGDLFGRLLDSGIVCNQEKLKESLESYRKLNSHLFSDVSLHIAVVTTRCNLNCLYCQTKSEKPKDMDIDVAARILKYVFDTQNPYANIEFQGGEPLLNWKIVTFITENARRINAGNKNLIIGLVTNGTLLDEKKLDFLCAHEVDICFSLDGPASIHDRNRVRSGSSAHKAVRTAIEKTKKAYRKRGIKRSVNMLCTLTRQSLAHPEKIIDEYLALGADRIALRPLSRLGMADVLWEKIGYTPEEFNAFWAKAMDYILELNKKGRAFQERLAAVILTKVFKKENPGYVDMMSPCGAARSVLSYMPNGDVYPCDEARMLKEDIFKLGNVLTDDYPKVMKNDNVFCLCESSLMELWDYRSAFQPWIGTCPVLNYAQGGGLVPKITTTPLHKNFSFQMRYIFDKIISDPQAKDIFLSWIK